MSPVIIEQDADIVSAPIYTLGEDSDVDEELLERVTTRLEEELAEEGDLDQINIEERIQEIIDEELGEEDEDEDADEIMSQIDFDEQIARALEADSAEEDEDEDEDEEDEEDEQDDDYEEGTDSDGERVVYIGAHSQARERTESIFVQDIIIESDSGSDAQEETAVVGEIGDDVEPQAQVAEMEEPVALEEIMNDVSSYVQSEKDEDVASEDSSEHEIVELGREQVTQVADTVATQEAPTVNESEAVEITGAVDEAVARSEVQGSGRRRKSSVMEELLMDVEDAIRYGEEHHPGHTQDDSGESHYVEQSLFDISYIEESTTLEAGGDGCALEERSDIEENIEKLGALTLAEELRDKEQFFDDGTPQEESSAVVEHDVDQDNFQDCDSDDNDPDMVAGNRQIWRELKREPWVSKDLSTILNATTDEQMPMPDGFYGRKKALMDLFLLLSRVVFFIDMGVRWERMFALIPEKFWLDHFSRTDTRQLLTARDKEVCINFMSRMTAVFEEWRLSHGFPKIPETQGEVQIAATKWAKLNRENVIEKLLETKSYKSDNWLKHIFADFTDVLPWADIIADGEVRRLTVQKVVLMSDLCFSQPVTVSEVIREIQRRRKELIRWVQGMLKDPEGMQGLRLDDESPS
ncbi:uncharacterized protein PAC_03518 [Phialocephala subalpina]|uniref:Uncharacterized protein n=1 Tax=Phialocephala subalpina TaxID=576137 RepID=A0A1L7WLJ4_9HELO|nr:uncharacterized protein PAC_03518 [Phialocephala subalpina]